jgi:hypothetical protein
VSPTYDWVFFLLPPVVALWLGFMISGTAFSGRTFSLFGSETTAAELGLGVVIHAHLVAVFFRSHGNPGIFKLYRARFIAVPIIVWLAIVSSTWLAITATVVATFWDVWHSGAQTFGFARIYERNAGVPSHVGRRLDLWANQLLYAGPILAGATLIDHVEVFDSYDEVGATLFTAIPSEVQGHQRYLTWAVLIGGVGFLVYYVLAQLRLRRQGYRISPLKIYLVASTGLCSIVAWGFNSWGEAFFIMNLFHAVQYMALVWAVERKTITGLFRVGRLPGSPQLAFAGFLVASFGYGFAAQALTGGLTSLWALTIVVSLMHFWYDGFVWSVRKSQV